jgi:hypothetical protein
MTAVTKLGILDSSRLTLFRRHNDPYARWCWSGRARIATARRARGRSTVVTSRTRIPYIHGL